jgi:hypothetical protein
MDSNFWFRNSHHAAQDRPFRDGSVRDGAKELDGFRPTQHFEVTGT